MSENIIEVILDVKTKNGDLVAVLKFNNISLKPIFLDKNTIVLGDEMKSRLFEIQDKNNARVNYTGKTIKRGFDENDFMKLEPNQSITALVNLNNYYEFLKGENEYAIKYDSINHSFESQEMFEMISNSVVVKYKK